MSIKLQDCCSLCDSESVHIACICNREVKTLCKSCLIDHLSDLNVSHDLVSIELASKIISNPSMLEKYYENISTVHEITNSLNLHATKLNRIRRTISESKEELMTQIELIFNDLLSKVEGIQYEISNKSKLMSEFKRTQCDEGRSLIDDFRAKGEQELYCEVFESLDIPIEKIIKLIKDNINIQYSDMSHVISKKRKIDEETKFQNIRDKIIDKEVQKVQGSNNQNLTSKEILKYQAQSFPVPTLSLPQTKKTINRIKSLDSTDSTDSTLPSQASKQESLSLIRHSDQRYIYIPDSLSKSLLKYDIITKQIHRIEISSMTRTFNHTSTCVLPNGYVLCAGFSDPVSSDAYLYNLDTQECQMLPYLFYPRYLISLIYHKGYVYAFGGNGIRDIITKTAERWNIRTHKWELLPNIKHAEGRISCVEWRDKIYLFCGDSKIIDIFNTVTLQFEEIELNNSETMKCDVIAFLYRNMVFILTYNYVQVYDLELNRLHQYENSYKYNRCSINNFFQYNDSIYYYNFHTNTVEKFCPSLLDSRDKSSAEYDSRNYNTRYIYRPNYYTSELLRLDLKLKSIETIDLQDIIPRKFIGTSICMLPNDEIFIAGFRHPVSGACYILNTNTFACRRVKDNPNPRAYISLLYHQNNVYALGGIDDSDASYSAIEKFDLSKERWSVLSSMKETRNAASCIGIDNKIYIFGGEEKPVEVYDIKYNRCTLSKLKLYEECIATKVRDVIYVIGNSTYQVVGKNLKVLEKAPFKNDRSDSLYSGANISIYQGCIYFFNEILKMYEKFNTLTGKRSILVINNL